MRNHAFLKVVLLGLLTFALAPGMAAASGQQGQDLTGMLATSAAERAAAASPIISVTPGSVLFPTTNAGSCAAAVMITISNVGDADLHVTDVSAPAPFSWTGATAFDLMPGEEYIGMVEFCPSDGSLSSENLTVVSDAANGLSYSILLEGRGNTAPFFSPGLASSYTLPTSVPAHIVATAIDGEGDALTWSFSGPAGPLFDTNTGALDWTPGAGDVGSYPAQICVSDGIAADVCHSFTIEVVTTNRPPEANAGGPYTGVRTVPVAMDATASSDPDGDALDFNWNFGDGAPAVTSGATISHAYAATGSYIVSVTATDNGSPPLSSSAFTTATIINFIPAQATAKLAGGGIKTFGGGRQHMGMEPAPASGIAASDIDPTTVKLSTTSPGAGSVSEISADLKGAGITDIDSDGQFELGVYFSRADLDLLLGNVPHNTVIELALSATTTPAKGSAPVRATGMFKIKSNGGPNAVTAAASPNPFNPETSLSYSLRNEGTVSIRIYSVNGHLVRTLRQEFATPGSYEVRWNGTDDQGRAVRSGIYFVNVAQGGNSTSTKVVVAK